MSSVYIYCILVSFLFEPLQTFMLMNTDSKILSVISKVKLSTYCFKRFYKQNVLSMILFLVSSTLAIYFDKSLIFYLAYLALLPLMLTHTQNYLECALFLLLPIPAILIKSSLLFFFLLILTYLFINKRWVTLTPLSETMENVFVILKYISPIFLIVFLTLQSSFGLIGQQTLIIGIFVMVSNMENSLTETKTLLDISRSRYIIWALKSESTNHYFLNKNSRNTLLSQTLIILYLTILLTIVSKNYTLVFVITLLFIYLLASELDILIQYKFFNQSILYDDALSRFVFSQVILSGLSFYLIYMGVTYLLQQQDYYSIIFSYIEFGFIVWYLFWIVFFIKRFKKTSIRSFKRIVIPVLLFTLVACGSANDTALVVSDDRHVFSGNMVSQQNQEIALLEDMVVKVSNGQLVEKGIVLAVKKNEVASGEIKRLNFQIEQNKTRIADLNKIINQTEDEFEKQNLQLERKTLEDELQLLNFDKGQINVSESIVANFNGTIMLKSDMLTLISNDLNLSLTLTENEYRMFKEIKNFEFSSLDKTVISRGDSYITLPIENTDSPLYRIQFDFFENSCYINQTILVRSVEPQIYVPAQYIRIDKDNMFAKSKETEFSIVATFDEFKNSYLIHDGLKDGDEILSYETVNPD